MTTASSETEATMVVCIFSFNRGRFLENCIRSVERCAPNVRIMVFDDDSTDPETRDILKTIEQHHTVIQPGHVSDHRLGGLYGNMQSALEYCADASLLCFLQDDTQMVRPLATEEIEAMNRQFDRDPKLGFLHPCFIRGINRTRGARYLYDEERKLYERAPTERSAGRHFSALLITRPERLLSAKWRFDRSEPANNKQAETLFRPMGYLFAPFAMWLPEAPAYRGKRKTLGLKLAEKKRNCGYYPFRILNKEETERLKERKPDTLPVAEDFLSCEGGDPPRPWAYNPLTGTGWIKALNQMEVSLRRLLSRR